MHQEVTISVLEESVSEQTKIIARNVRYLRKSSHLKIREYADLTGLSDSKISDIENCRAPNMEIRTITRLALAFDMKPGDIMRDWGY